MQHEQMNIKICNHFWLILFCWSLGLQGSNESILSAFGELLTIEPTGIIQLAFSYNINSDYVTTTTTGVGSSVTHSGNFAVLATGTSLLARSAMMVSNDRLLYQAGQGCSCLFTALFSTPAATSTQIIGIGNAQDGFFFGYNGTSFGVLYRKNFVDTWVAQAAWNGDRFNGIGVSGITINPLLGNVFKIQYQWLGFGAIKFFIENPSDGSFVLVHTIQYANTNTTTSTLNPSLQLMASVTNSAVNATNVTVQTSSMAAFLEGALNFGINVRNSVSSSKNLSTAATPFSVLVIRNKALYQGVNNQVVICPDMINVMHPGNQDIIYTLWLNATVIGTVFSDISTNTSVVDFSTAGTTVIGGKLIVSFNTTNNTFTTVDLTKYRIALNPSDQLAIVAQTISGTGTTYASISWVERF